MPEIEPAFTLTPDFGPFLEKIKRAQALIGNKAAAILVGPVTFISLAKSKVPMDEALKAFLPVYAGEGLNNLNVRQYETHLDISLRCQT